MSTFAYDAITVGAGPNGLAAAITMAQAGQSVLVVEAAPTVGGGMRSTELTLPGFTHDVCSAVHPMGLGSPFFRSLPLASHGLSWIHPPAPLAHPFDQGPPALLERSIDETCVTLGEDAGAYYDLIEPLTSRWNDLAEAFLGPLRLPRHPLLLARFGIDAIRSARRLAESRFDGRRARGLFGGLSAHSTLPLEKPPSAAFGIMLAIAGHAIGWPIARGGSQRIADALASYLRSLGGVIETGRRVGSIDELPRARVYLFNVTPLQLLKIAGSRLPSQFRRKLELYRYGPAAFKLDYALSAPIPWKSPECARAGTVHLGGTLDEISASESGLNDGIAAERPYVLVTQPSLFDDTRAPAGKHVAWVYCHVPHASQFDMTARIEAQIERFAPGFRDVVLARSALSPADMERRNANYIGGDINGGVQDFFQLFTRPTARIIPYATPARDIFLCSSSTPPGGGVHGMCGHFAARAALAALRGETGYAAAPRP
jgi:phytoene dehydrogenase-like protein